MLSIQYQYFSAILFLLASTASAADTTTIGGISDGCMQHCSGYNQLVADCSLVDNTASSEDFFKCLCNIDHFFHMSLLCTVCTGQEPGERTAWNALNKCKSYPKSCASDCSGITDTITGCIKDESNDSDMKMEICLCNNFVEQVSGSSLESDPFNSNVTNCLNCRGGQVAAINLAYQCVKVGMGSLDWLKQAESSVLSKYSLGPATASADVYVPPSSSKGATTTSGTPATKTATVTPNPTSAGTPTTATASTSPSSAAGSVLLEKGVMAVSFLFGAITLGNLF